MNNKKVTIPIPLNMEKSKNFLDNDDHTSNIEKLNNLVKKCVKEWCEDTTSHGFSNIVKTDSWLIRIVWVILVIIFMGYCVYSVVISVVAYTSYETTINYQVMAETPAEFPAITICNLNPFDIATDPSTAPYMLKKLTENNIPFNLVITDDDFGIKVIEKTVTKLTTSVLIDKNLTSDDLKKLGFTLETMMISCFYNNENCNETDFTWFRDPEFGNCYTFNHLYDSKKNIVESKKTSKAGQVNGLSMEIFIGAAGYQDYYSLKRGIKVIVHERGKLPLLKYQGISVSTGTATNIAITRTNYSKLEAPYSDCRKDTNTILKTDSEYYKNTLKISNYYQRLCFEICMQYSQIIPNCGCADGTIVSIDSNQTICNDKSSLDCVKTQKDYFDKQNIDEMCGDECPLECDSVTYSTSVSSAKYPTKYYSDLLLTQNNVKTKFNTAFSFSMSSSTQTQIIANKNLMLKNGQPVVPPNSSPLSNSSSGISNITSANNTLNGNLTINISNNSNTNTTIGINVPKANASISLNNNNNGQSTSKTTISSSDLENSILMISVYYEDLRYTYIEESPSITFETLVGVIGGQFGLFMGASFLSFVEVLEMVINLIRISFKYRKEKKKLAKISSITSTK